MLVLASHLDLRCTHHWFFPRAEDGDTPPSHTAVFPRLLLLFAVCCVEVKPVLPSKPRGSKVYTAVARTSGSPISKLQRSNRSWAAAKVWRERNRPVSFPSPEVCIYCGVKLYFRCRCQIWVEAAWASAVFYVLTERML